MLLLLLLLLLLLFLTHAMGQLQLMAVLFVVSLLLCLRDE
jgi:hypothetical protein